MLKAVVAEPALARGCLGYCPVGLMSLGRGPSGRPGREAKTARIGCAPSTYVLSGWGQVGNLHFSAPGAGQGKAPSEAAWASSVGWTRPAPQRTGLFSKFLGFSFLPFLPPAQKHQNLGESGKLFVGGWFGGRRRVRSRLFPQPTLSHCHCLNLLARAHCRMGHGDAPFAR